jgi:hypothetical protein
MALAPLVVPMNSIPLNLRRGSDVVDRARGDESRDHGKLDTRHVTQERKVLISSGPKPRQAANTSETALKS